MQRKSNVASNRTHGKVTEMNAIPPKLLAQIDPKAAALRAWPIFGGSSPTPPATATPPANPEQQQPNPAATPPATSPAGAPQTAQQPGGAASVDVNQLLAQVQSLSSQIQQLQTENQGYKQKETEAENAKKTREQQLEQTIQQKDQQIAAAQNLIAQKSLENALLTHKDYQWHDANDALLSLRDAEGVKVTVDIDKQIATVEGLDNAVKELATKKPWMLSKGPEQQPDPNNPQQQTPPAAPGRPSGKPPAPPANPDAAKVQQRQALGKKYSAIRGAPIVAG
ncbi:head scaffolding protein [Mycobacterium phage Barnyard]|uniref:Scaffolding protein n=1 Tax=Mycobacterium phage Barnyard TaxID=205880 RepID=Q856F3_9CAUD|nr:head scaffolding protein [Mycobacterium phage Barnyard]AAN02073.1 hypothetical protein PBI_BARNYARD_19 [Mycobacterium phage Barnyard]